MIASGFTPRTAGDTKAVAEDLDMTVNAVYIARSRVLTRLRQEGRGIVESEFSGNS